MRTRLSSRSARRVVDDANPLPNRITVTSSQRTEKA